MIDIYAMHYKRSDGTIQENRTLIQSVPAMNEGDIKIINPKVSVKMGNAEGMDFSIQPGSVYYDAFIQMRTYLEVEYDGDLIFYGRVLTIEQGFYGEQKIKMEGAMAFFNDSYFPGEKESNREEISLGTYITNILTNHNEQLNDPLRAIYPGEVPGNYTSATSAEQRIDEVTRKFGESGWRQTKVALDDLVSHYGGMFRIRHSSNGNMYLDWYKHYYRASINNQVIEVGKNLIDASSITEVNNIFTVIIPIGKGDTSEDKIYITGRYFPVSRVTEFYTDAELNSGYHLASDYREAESRYGVIIKPQEFTEADTEEKLLAECAKWVKENYQGGVEEFSVTAVDFHQIGDTTVQKILCGDRVRLRYPIGNGQLRERTLTCTSVSYELYNPENNAYTFGIPASSLSKGYSVNSSKSDQDAEANQEPPKGMGTPDNRTDYEKWYDRVVNWLIQHRVWKNHNGGTEGGPNGTRELDLFVHMVGSTGEEEMAEIWIPTYYDLHFERTGRPSYGFRLDINGHPMGSWKRVPRRYFYRSKTDYERKYDLTSNKLIEYIYYEHGVDFGADKPDEIIGGPLGNIMNSSKFETLFDEEGNPMKELIGQLDLSTIMENGKTMIKETVGNVFSGVFGQDGSGFNIKSIGEGIFNVGEKFTMMKDAVTTKVNMIFGDLKESGSSLFGNFQEFSFTDPETGIETIMSSINSDGGFFSKGDIDTDGDVTLTDNEGNKVSVREVNNNTDKLGYVATKYFGDVDNPQIVTYEFTQSIETYTNGKIVVARVEGDQVILGGQNASSVVTTALNNVSQVCGEFTTETDPDTGERKVKVKNGTGLYLQKNNASFGLYMTPEGETDAVLTGGIMVEKLNDNTVTTHIKGNRIIVGTVDDPTAQTMQEKFGDVDGLIAQKATIAELNAAKARISTLETHDLIVTGTLSVSGGDIFTTGNINAGLSQDKYIRGKTLRLIGASSSQGAQEAILSYSDVNTMIIKAAVSGNTLQLWTHGDDTAGSPSITFSKATTLTGAWSGGVYTVTASPQGNTRTVGFAQNVDSPLTLATNGTPTSVSTNRKLVSAPVRIIETKGTTQTNVYTASLTIDSTAAWNYGYDTARGHVVLPSAGTGTTFNVGVPKSDRSGSENKTFEITKGATPAASGYAAVNLSGTVVGRIDIGNWYSAGVTAGKAAEKELVKVRFNAANGAYYAEAYENVSGAPAISGSSVTYKLGSVDSGNNTIVQIQNSSGTKITNTPELTVAKTTVDPANDVSVNNPTWYDSTASLPSVDVTLTTMGNVFNTHKNGRGYIYFNVTIAGVQGSKKYRIPIGTA